MSRARWSTIPLGDPGRPTAAGAWAVRHVVGPWAKLSFRPTVEGWEHLPEGPFLLVANHAAGMGLAEIGAFAALYLDRFGGTRPLAGFAHPGAFLFPGIGGMLRALGAVPSTYEAAAATLGAGVPLLVFPGGDHETLRPFWQARRVDFAGRQGFLRIARAHGVPIVPLGVSPASHLTAPVLFHARWLATALVVPRALGLKRFGITLLGALGVLGLALLPLPLALRLALSWAWLGSPLVFAPVLPLRVRFRIGPALRPEELFPPGPDPLPSALVKVEGAVRKLALG